MVKVQTYRVCEEKGTRVYSVRPIPESRRKDIRSLHMRGRSQQDVLYDILRIYIYIYYVCCCYVIFS